MRYDARHRSRNARSGTPPPEPTPAEKAVITVGLLAVGAWLFAHPTALAVAVLALGTVLLLVGVPLAVIRVVIAVGAALEERKGTATDERTRRDPDAEAPEHADATVPAE